MQRGVGSDWDFCICLQNSTGNLNVLHTLLLGRTEIYTQAVNPDLSGRRQHFFFWENCFPRAPLYFFFLKGYLTAVGTKAAGLWLLTAYLTKWTVILPVLHFQDKSFLLHKCLTNLWREILRRSGQPTPHIRKPRIKLWKSLLKVRVCSQE